ncbi:DUF4232 domain-containing protein [Frigoribacterium faeni]|uniref:DUF4232 domain-containing protein n=1 Tax=Frigoribacterium faeni TaxID=145483 RepID=UPI00141BCE8E|nr:DUF4232 domain-containing protein [Frigoribacterium faeni]NIJ06356.1 hypothetical protein [Frigoribacterium faeni]
MTDEAADRPRSRLRTRASGPTLVAATAAGLWLVSGALAVVVSWSGLLPASVGAVLPATIPFSPGVRPWAWGVGTSLLAAAVVFLVARLLVPLATRVDDRTARVALAWFAIVLAGGAAGLALDLATIVAALPAPRLRMLLDGLGTDATVGAWWGVVQGWLPALLVRRRAAALAPSEPEPDDELTAGRTAATPSRARRRQTLLVATAVVAVAAVVATGALGQRAARVASAQEAAVAEGADPALGALPDPYAEGTPVPTLDPGRDPDRDPSWCTRDQAMMLLGETGAATGHRSQTLRLTNYTDAPCVVEGYPDVAFADQNGHELAVTAEQGGSFLAEDRGYAQFELPAGASAVTTLGWDAGATSGALVARTLYAAPFATDERGSWPVELDVVAGSVVHVTAWSLETGATP